MSPYLAMLELRSRQSQSLLSFRNRDQRVGVGTCQGYTDRNHFCRPSLTE